MTEVTAKSKKTISRIIFLPFDIALEVPLGTRILDAIKKAGLPLSTSCGGKGTCGDCLVQILKGNYQSKQSAALPDQLQKKGYALACLTEAKDDLFVHLPKFQQITIQAVSTYQFFEENKDRLSGIYEVNPSVKKVKLRIPPPSLEDNSSDLKRLMREVEKKEGIETLNCEYSVLKKLAHTVRKKGGEISAVLFGSGKFWKIIDIEPSDGEEKIYGLSCDLGTTTVVLNLVDLKNGKTLETASSLNQQISRGEDIISRINYAQKSSKLRELRKLIVTTVNNLIEKVAKSAQISPFEIYYASFSGNTTMTHFFLNLEPRYIREEPYVPTFNDLPLIPNRNLGLKINPEAMVHFAPAVGSYVGGDITAGLLCTPILCDAEKISVFIDAGTNGELVVGNKEWLVTCACSAGPAFEGSGIKCGMPATEGAIEKIKLNDKGETKYTVIGKIKPKGLCGSGLVDLLAELFFHGFIDRFGKFTNKTIKTRLYKNETETGFLIENASHCYWGKALIITEKDIANLIRTKAAVFSACSLLLKKVGLNFDRIDDFYIAGGFGQHLNIENAICIGLLPDLELAKFHYLGNSSLLGASLILLSDKNREIVKEIAKKMTYIELNTEPQYMNEYTGALFLPHTNMDLFPSLRKILKAWLLSKIL